MENIMIEYVRVEELNPYENNTRSHDDADIEKIAKSIEKYGFNDPIGVWKDNVIVEGHGRLQAANKLGMETVPVIRLEHLTDEQRREYAIAHNRTAEFSEWDFEKLKEELDALSFEDFDLEFEIEPQQEEVEVEEDDFDLEDVSAEPKSKRGQVWQLGRHRLMCGDSTSWADVEKLIGGRAVDLVFTDPPYGMKKEGAGVANDNLNYDDLLEFNKKWIPLTFRVLKDTGSWYCWGIDEPLMDIYSNILKPMHKENRITFRNLLTWDKGHGQGQLSDEFRMYAPADEKCLFVMCGVQGFNTNADNYFEQWEPIRKYLYDSRVAMGWDVPTMKRIVGHSDLSRDHWTSKSQFNMPTREVYEAMKNEAERQRIERGIENDAFKREYDDIKREYDDIKREYYSTRAYFDNTHDNMNSVWHFDRTSGEEKETAGGHATPKPIALCSRAIKSSSREGEAVLDVFGGSGSTLIACEELGRNAYMMELEPKWCDVIIARWEKYTGEKAVLLDDE